MEKILFASISFFYETKTTPTSLNDSEEIEETEQEKRDIVSTANLLAEKTEEIVHEIVADSQKVPKSTGDSVDEISFTGIVVSAGVTAEIIGKTKITSKGDIAAIGSWGNSFNLKLSGDVNGKFYMGVPINGVLSSMLRIPQLMFFIGRFRSYFSFYILFFRYMQVFLWRRSRCEFDRRKLLRFRPWS